MTDIVRKEWVSTVLPRVAAQLPPAPAAAIAQGIAPKPAPAPSAPPREGAAG